MRGDGMNVLVVHDKEGHILEIMTHPRGGPVPRLGIETTASVVEAEIAHLDPATAPPELAQQFARLRDTHRIKAGKLVAIEGKA